MAKTYCLIDGSGYIFRAYYALPPMNRSDGTPINAVYGFTNMLIKLLTSEDPKTTHIAVIFDAKRKNFRNDIYPEYKANRLEPPEELVPQFPIIREATRAFNLPVIEKEGYEADDLIATFVKEITKQGDDVIVVTSDKDLTQLMNGYVKIWDPMKARYMKDEDVKKKFGVSPDKVVEVQTLMGDSTDNIPGVKGVGPKTAAKLIGQYGTVDELLKHIDEVEPKGVKAKLKDNIDMIPISRKLVELKSDVDIDVNFDEMEFHEVDKDMLLRFIDKNEFKTIRNRVENWLGEKKEGKNESDTGPEDFDYSKYELVDNISDLKKWIEEIKKKGRFGFDTETNNLDPILADLVGFSIATDRNKACYVPLGHKNMDVKEDLFDDGYDNKVTDFKQIDFNDVLPLLKEILEDKSILKIGHNLKYDMHVLFKYGIKIAPFEDTMVMSYVLDNSLHKHNLDDLAYFNFKHQNLKYDDICKVDGKKVTFDFIDPNDALNYAAEDADVTFRLYQLLEKRLKDEKMMRVYEKLDKPLVEVLQNMEALGVKVDVENLKNLSSEFAKKMADLENEIHKLAGRPFNLASPKQLGEILFDELSIPYSKSKTKSGEYRTDANYLEELAAQGYELPEKILVWRGLAKLKSTYSDALVSDINPNTGRIHTSFMQTVVLSGRLSSNNPNLQNIPIKNEDGRKIRQAFVADKGGKILSADYSQVELRIIAAVSKCSALLEAFKEGADIHKATASGIFGVNEDEVTSEMRRQAKVVNFSLIYGSTHWGLARNLGISKGEAKNYIDRYFARYPEILDFMEKQKQIGFEKGYVETLFGRKCYISGFTNPKMKASAERAAINAPIQGTAADVMRFAMIKMHDLIKTGKLDAKMIIQVHDELVFEVGEAKVDGVREVIKETMENAAPSLDIELPVEVGAGDNWDEAH